MSPRLQPDVGTPGGRVFAALLWRWVEGEPLSVRALAGDVGRSTSSVHRQLVLLRRLGLVDWEPGRAGTLRPTVAIVVPRRAA